MKKPTVLIVCLVLAFFAISERACAPTCENLTLDNNQLRTKCAMTIAHQYMKCQFTLQKGGIDKLNVTDHSEHITHTYMYVNKTLLYTTSCTLEYPVGGLEPGNWAVIVIMYLEGSFNQGLHGQASNTLLLSVPTVNIDPHNCPKGLPGEGDTVRDGYIRQGERASCLCTRAHAGNPPGKVEWNSTENFVILSQSEYWAKIQINSPGTFICQSVSVLDGSHSKTFTPKYAYGPTHATVTIQPPEPIYLCPNQQTNITITCQVPANSFNPAPLFFIRERSDYLAFKSPGDTARSKSGNYGLNRSGAHKFLCRTENAIFTDISILNWTNLQVHDPPNTSLSIQVTGTSVKTDELRTWVKQGSDINVSCLVGGDYSLITSVTLRCGQNASSSGNFSVTGVSGDVLECHCSVDDESKIPCKAPNLTKNINIEKASTNSEMEDSQDSFPIGAAVGGAVGAFIVIAVVVVGVIFCVRRGRKQKESTRSVQNGYDTPVHDPTEVHVDNSELYLSFNGYNPQRDPTARFTDNSELYGMASQGYNPQQDPKVVFRDNSELYGTVSKGPPSYVNVKDDDHEPATVSAAAIPEKYNPEINLYDEIEPEKLKKEQKLFATKPKTKPTTGPKPKLPSTPKPNNVAPGGPPVQSAYDYEEE